MGIDKYRFIGENIEIFICGICKDVANDPIFINECQHCICRTCLPDEIKKCPTCYELFSGQQEIDRVFKKAYLNLKLSCISCEEILTVRNYVQHESSCPANIYECPEFCGFKVHNTLEEEIYQHTCIDYLMEDAERLRNEVTHLKNTNNQLKTELQQHKFDRVRCGRVLKTNVTFYRCFTCQRKRMSAICVECFAGNHSGHRFKQLVSKSDYTFCDCGETEILDGSPCHQHKF